MSFFQSNEDWKEHAPNEPVDVSTAEHTKQWANPRKKQKTKNQKPKTKNQTAQPPPMRWYIDYIGRT